MQSAGGFLPYADHLPNVRAALTWSFSEAGDRAIGVDLAASAAQFFLELTLLTECHSWTQQALASADAVDSRKEMALQAALGVSVMFTQGNTEGVRSAFTRSLHLAQELDDLHWQLWLLRGLHIYLTRVGDFHGALGTGEQGAKRRQEAERPDQHAERRVDAGRGASSDRQPGQGRRSSARARWCTIRARSG